MKPKGEDTAEALRNWIKKDIEEGPSSKNRLGQFFFGVSTSTIGLFVGLKSFVPGGIIDTLLIASLFILFLSSIIALYMACPYIMKLSGDADIFDLYIRQINKIKYLTLIWFAAWVLGATLGIYSILITSR